jgi:hypothetical protein
MEFGILVVLRQGASTHFVFQLHKAKQTQFYTLQTQLIAETSYN